MGLTDRIQNAFNAFMNKDPTRQLRWEYGSSYGSRPDRVHLSRGNERSIINAVYNRIAVDCAMIDIRHVMVDDEDRFVKYVKDGLDDCLSLEANIDQTGRALIQDAVQSMLDEGSVCIAPIDTESNPNNTDSIDILTMRTGKVVEWYPTKVKVRAYNDRKGTKEEVIFNKEKVALVENPFYSIMNEPNSTSQRLIRKLNLLDAIDEQSSSGKLDLIIQLPYVIRSDARKAQAEDRRKDIERQLAGSKYGIAYTDGTERITQLNRPVENNLLNQIEYLTNMLFAQLGITQSILDGTADENTFNNYYSRTIEPIMTAMAEEMKRKFLSKTARTRGHSIKFFNNPFNLVPITELIKLADTFTRNEIMTSNEVRQIMGMKPSQDPNADQLRNKNLNQSTFSEEQQTPIGQMEDAEATGAMNGELSGTALLDSLKNQLAQLDELDAQLDDLEKELG